MKVNMKNTTRNIKLLVVALSLSSATGTSVRAETIGNGNGGYIVNAIRQANQSLSDIEILQKAFDEAAGKIPPSGVFSGKRVHVTIPTDTAKLKTGVASIQGPLFTHSQTSMTENLGPLLGSSQIPILAMEHVKLALTNNALCYQSVSPKERATVLEYKSCEVNLKLFPQAYLEQRKDSWPENYSGGPLQDMQDSLKFSYPSWYGRGHRAVTTLQYRQISPKEVILISQFFVGYNRRWATTTAGDRYRRYEIQYFWIE